MLDGSCEPRVSKEFLDLSRNFLRNFSSEGLPRLLELNLSSNRLGSLSSWALAESAGLRQLTMRAAGLTSIEEDSFGNLTQLQFLDLADNELSELPDFHQLTWLLHLEPWWEIGASFDEDLSLNSLTSLDPGVLAPLEFLVPLGLSGCLGRSLEVAKPISQPVGRDPRRL